ncbi:MAG: amino acid racemase [Patescibacteria group bacterium]
MPTSKNKKVVGIIGGMGPLATIELQRFILEYTPARRDQDHIQVIIHNNPQIPDRTLSLLENGGESFIKEVVATGKKLIESGATVLCMPCSTAHARFREIQSQLSKPLIDMVKLTVDEITNRQLSQPIIILATDGSIKEKVFTATFTKNRISYILPNIIEQKKIMKIIYDIKAGKKTSLVKSLRNFIKKKNLTDSCSVLLGCTELGLCENELQDIGVPLINPLRILGRYIAQY